MDFQRQYPVWEWGDVGAQRWPRPIVAGDHSSWSNPGVLCLARQFSGAWGPPGDLAKP